MLNPFSLQTNIPNALLDTGISLPDKNPLSTICLKTLLFLIFSFNNKGDEKFVIQISDLCELFGHSNKDQNNNHSHHARKIISHLNMIVEQPLYIRRYRGQGMIRIVCIESLKANIRKNQMEVIFSQEFIKYLRKGTTHYSSTVDLRYLFRLHTFASVVLYLFFVGCSSNSSYFSVPTEKLANLLTGNINYPYKYLKNDMLLPALELINSKTDINVMFDEEKYAKKVTALNFSIKQSPADDEILRYCEFEGITMEEYEPEQYNTTWQDLCDYSLVKQAYYRCTFF